MKLGSVIPFLLILFLTGCSKKEVPNFEQEELVGRWVWVETYLRELDIHNWVETFDTIPPHKVFMMTYYKNEKVKVFQNEIPKGQKYNSYIQKWDYHTGRQHFTLILGKSSWLHKWNDYEFNQILGHFTGDTMYLSDYDHSYFNLPHPDYLNKKYMTLAVLKRAEN